MVEGEDAGAAGVLKPSFSSVTAFGFGLAGVAKTAVLDAGVEGVAAWASWGNVGGGTMEECVADDEDDATAGTDTVAAGVGVD